MILVAAEVLVKEGTQEQFLKLAEKCVAETRKEEGCIVYDLVRDAFDQCKFMFYEEWETKGHLEAHMKTAHFEVFAGSIPDLLAGELKAKFFKAETITM